jgi:hypothetical protein
MMSPMFESLVLNSLTILADEPDDATAMVWNEAETQAELEGNEKAIYRLELNDKEILLEDIEDLIAYNKTHKVKDLRLDKNEFFDEGVELLAEASALEKLLTLSLAYNKLSDNAVRSLAASKFIVNLQKLFLQGNQILTVLQTYSFCISIQTLSVHKEQGLWVVREKFFNYRNFIFKTQV